MDLEKATLHSWQWGFFCHFQRESLAYYWFYDSTEDPWIFAAGLAGIHGHCVKPVTAWLWNKAVCDSSEATSRKFSPYEPLVICSSVSVFKLKLAFKLFLFKSLYGVKNEIDGKSLVKLQYVHLWCAQHSGLVQRTSWVEVKGGQGLKRILDFFKPWLCNLVVLFSSLSSLAAWLVPF